MCADVDHCGLEHATFAYHSAHRKALLADGDALGEHCFHRCGMPASKRGVMMAVMVEVVMVEVVMEATVRAVLTVLMGLVLRAAMWGGPPRCAGAGARSHEVAGRRNLLAG